MGINFTVKDIMHEISAKFVRTFLPTAKEAYNLRAVHQPEVDIHGIASKAEVYNTGISPRVIEEGLAAGIKIMFYLAADGYKIKTPLYHHVRRIEGLVNASFNTLSISSCSLSE
jgi:tagatose-1,6-bisphosphate aldolase